MPLGAVIGLPCWQTWDYRFSMCLQSLSPPMNYATRTVPVVGKRIDIARNEIVKVALDAGAEHILFLDSDVLFPPNTFQQLLLRQRNHGHKIVSGVYWSKSNPTFPLIFHDAGRGSNMDWKVGDYIKAPYAIGMGLVLIHTDVFRAIPEPWYTINYGLSTDAETGGMSASSMTEDLPFCERALKAGFDIWVDTGIQAGHLEANSNTVFGLNESMPQAQGREPLKSETLYIGEILAGGEPAHVLSQNKELKPTWFGPPSPIPTTQVYERVAVKGANIPFDQLPDTISDWVAHVKPGGFIEIMHPDFLKLYEVGPISGNVYKPEVIEDGLRANGMVEVTKAEDREWWVIKANKPSNTDPIVSIIIVGHDLEEMTLNCVTSVREHTKGIDYEIIVVDNGSDPPYKPMGDKNLRLEDNFPFGVATTQGSKLAHPCSRYFLLLNNDTQAMQDEWLANLHAKMKGNGAIAVAGPKQLFPQGTLYAAGIAFSPDRVPYHESAGFAHDHPSVQAERFVQALNFGCALIRREVFEQHGLDPRYELCGNYEDIDFCLRIRKLGMMCLYTPTAEILHFGAQTQAAMPEWGRRSVEENRAKFIERWKDDDPALFGLEGGQDDVHAEAGNGPSAEQESADEGAGVRGQTDNGVLGPVGCEAGDADVEPGSTGGNEG